MEFRATPGGNVRRRLGIAAHWRPERSSHLFALGERRAYHVVRDEATPSAFTLTLLQIVKKRVRGLADIFVGKYRSFSSQGAPLGIDRSVASLIDA
jgi:hypothetical protein